jgi:sec-independent protein translocase protein TatA
MLPFGFHPAWLLVLLVVVLVIFGPGKLPELGGAVGRAMRDFQKTVSGARDDEPPTPELASAEAPADNKK